MNSKTIFIKEYNIILDRETAWVSSYFNRRFRFGDCNSEHTKVGSSGDNTIPMWNALREAIYE